MKLLTLEFLNLGLRFHSLRKDSYGGFCEGMSHHMGTLKMSKNKSKGVVDENMKLNDIKNLYLCSSAIFPTYGQSNPTYTIAALSIKLSDYLKNKCI